MVATSDFSGLVSSACALGSASALLPRDSLTACMAALHAQDIKAHRAGFGSSGSDAMANRLLGVLGNQGLELRLGILQPEVRSAGGAARVQTVEGAHHSQRSARIFSRP